MKIFIVIKLLNDINRFEETELDKSKHISEIKNTNLVQKTPKLILLSKILDIKGLFILPKDFIIFNYFLFDNKENNIIELMNIINGD